VPVVAFLEPLQTGFFGKAVANFWCHTLSFCGTFTSCIYSGSWGKKLAFFVYLKGFSEMN
jgi:hypothetical protein